MSQEKNFARNLVELNIAIFLISTSGVLGRYIDVPAPLTICLRSVLGASALFLFCKFKKIDLNIKGKDRWTVFAGGILFGIHWVTYFISLQMSNVAIGMLSLYTYPVLTTLLEPLIRRTKISFTHVGLAVFILGGIYFLVPEFDMKNDYFVAILFGVISAISYALRNIILKSKVNEYGGSSLMFYQLLTIIALTSPLFFFLDSSHVVEYLPYTIILGLVTTAMGHTMFLYSLRNFSTITASIISSLQPIFGIIMGYFILSEVPELNTIVGGTIILSSVIVESMRAYNQNKQSKPLALDDLDED